MKEISPENWKRNSLIKALRQSGCRYKQLASEFGLSWQRLMEIVSRYKQQLQVSMRLSKTNNE